MRLPAGLDPARGMQFRDAGLQACVRDTTEDELQHVKVLHAAPGSAAAVRPVLDLAGAFDAAGQAASGGKIRGFNPYASDLFLLHGAFIFEDVGMTACNGAATLIGTPADLRTAASILATGGLSRGRHPYAALRPAAGGSGGRALRRSDGAGHQHPAC